MKVRIVLSCVLLLIYIVQSNGQSVDYLTGRLQMSIPIGTISANDVSISLGLVHHGNKTMVAEGEDDCGVGWGLAAGGAIYREVRGLPDEIDEPTKKGWLYNNRANAIAVQSFIPTADDNLSVCTDEVQDWNTLEALHLNYQNDTEPDIFYVQAPGISAKFVFGVDGLPKLLTHQDISIIIPSSGYINSIEVKTNTGFVYTFGNGTTESRDRITRRGYKGTNASNINTLANFFYGDDFSFVSTWKLVSLKGPSGTEAIYSYVPQNYSQGLSPTGGGKSYFTSDSTSYVLDIHYRFKLRAIFLKSYTATFNWDFERLRSVSITESVSNDKSVTNFEYHSIKDNNSSYWRSFLRSVKQNAANCINPLMYEFEYYDISYYPIISYSTPSYINWKKYWGQDFYGYPNGVGTNKNRPTLYLSESSINGRRLRVQQFPGDTYTTIPGGDDRAPSASIFFGALKRLNNPNGGYTEIVYEPNYFMESGTQFIGPGIRVKQIIAQGGEAGFAKNGQESSYRAIKREFEYTLAANSNTSGLLSSPPKLGYIINTGAIPVVNNLGEAPMVMYTRVKEKVAGKGSTIYEYQVPAMFPQTAVGEWKATKSRIARKPNACIPFGKLKNGYYLFPYAPSSNYDYKRGLPTKVTVLSETGSLISEKTISYEARNGITSTIKGLRFEKLGDTYYHAIYEILTGRVDLVSQEVINEASPEDPTKLFERTISYSYNAKNLLEKRTVVRPNFPNTITSYRYAMDFPFTNPPQTDTAAVAIKALNDAGRGGTLVEEWTAVGSNTIVLNANLISYRDFGNGLILPYYLKSLQTGSVGSLFNPAAMNSQNFTHSPYYSIKRTLKEYDEEGRLLTEWDDKKNVSSIHYLKDLSIPTATYYNARANQSVSDGFEGVKTFGLSQTGGFETTSGWTGEKAIVFTTTSSKLSSSATELIQKNGNKYRFSCWINSVAGKTLTIKAFVGATEVSSLTLTNSVAGQWNYLEGELNTTPITSTFRVEITSNAAIGSTIAVDEIVFLPSQARVSLQTILPFKGITSTTDDKGNSVKTTYDNLGRPVNTFDRYRNLVSKSEYALENSNPRIPTASFTAGAEKFYINTPILFTPGTWECDPGISYAWEVDGVGVASGSNNTLTHSFTTPGKHVVRLTVVSAMFGTNSFVQEFCVQHVYSGAASYVVTNAQGQPAGLVLDCNSGLRNIDLVLPPAPVGCGYHVQWTKNGSPYSSGSGLSVYGYSPGGSNPVTELYVATITLDCSAYKDCTFIDNHFDAGTVSVSVSFQPNPNCQ
ncbi:MAG: PKD domain-containing protein [Cyclobacteriaceae bacterium]|nr:PKD domain-containing protein [Cyclobacteriaceae bacterium]